MQVGEWVGGDKGAKRKGSAYNVYYVRGESLA
jgi:hypothetical protein